LERDSCAAAKVGVVEFLNGVGKGVETHAAKVEEAVGGDLQSLLHARTLRLKKLGIPCKQVISFSRASWFISVCAD
jgi:hypothetical protein